MLGRRLVAFLVAVLCIAGWVGVRAVDSRADEVAALAGPALVGRQAAGSETGNEGSECEVDPQGPTPPDALLDAPSALPPVPVLGLGSSQGQRLAAPALGRRGNPGAPRGPPLLVVS